jgi:hypothetical protein
MPQNESYPAFTPSFQSLGINEKKKIERDRAELSAALKEIVVVRD